MSTRYQGRHRASKVTRLGRARTTAKTGLAGTASLAVAATLGFAAAPAQAAPNAAVPAAPVAATAATATAVPTTVRTNVLTGTVRYGHRGANVRLVQAKVGVKVDGVFGRQTVAAVKRYQSANGLVADGIVGAKTAAKMGLRAGSTASAPASRTTPQASRSTARTPLAATSGVLGTAHSLVGTPYRWGGTTPSGFDCSGFTQYVFARNGIKLPRTAEQQRRATKRVSNPQPGDLVFINSPATHVGIYAGNGQFYDAGRSGKSTSKRKIWSSKVSYGRP
ncbi:MAG TPA: cell wall lytic activity [Intrasporangiaceae bacterium]|nr:cell wall lytic activity [Intrasporangiaceae bacterium]